MARLIRCALAFIALSGFAGLAHAEVVSIISAIGAALTSTTAVVVMTAISVVSQISAQRSAKKKAKAAEARKLADDLANLQDRTTTILQTDAPHAVIYGEPAPVGGAVAAVMTGGQYSHFKHIVMVLASHPCEAVTDVQIDGVSIGMDANGWSTNPDFIVTDSEAIGGVAGVNVQVHLSPGGVDVADGFMRSQMDPYPASAGKWSEAHKLSGKTYIVVTLNLWVERFQGGLPQITATVKGKKVYDPRTGATVYSRNPALCLADFLRSEEGYLAAANQIEQNALIAAANACDTPIYDSFALSDRANYGGSMARYVVDGMFRSDQDRDSTRQQLEDAMAGFSLESGGVWRILAGAWTTPVMSLTDDDLVAPSVVVQTCNPGTARYNGAKGSFVSLTGNGTSEDFRQYQNPAFRAADEKDKFIDLVLPFTGSHVRTHQIARVQVEQSRGGFVLKIHPKMSAWPLQPGDRITLSSGLFGFTNKNFRVQDWSYSMSSPLAFVVVEDEESFYDTADETLSDPSPNTNLPNPFLPPLPPSDLTVASGMEHVIQQDATVIVRVLVTWAPSTEPSVRIGGSVRVQWRLLDTGEQWQTADLPGDASETYLMGLSVGGTYQVRVRFATAYSGSAWAMREHLVRGKTLPPGSVTGLQLSIEADGLHARWQPPAGMDLLDWSRTELRIGTSWEAAADVWSGKATAVNLGWQQAGIVRIWAAHSDTIGRWSAPVSAAIEILSPTQPLITARVWRNEVELRWGDCTTSQPLRHYQVQLGPVQADAPTVSALNATSYMHVPTASGLHLFWVTAIDMGGNRSAPGYFEAVTFPGIDVVLAELTDDLATLDGLVPRVDAVENAAEALQGEIAELAATSDEFEARVDALTAQGEDDDSELSAALIRAAIAQVKGDQASVRRIESLEAELGEGIDALIQVEQEARVSADEALAQQITTAQAELDGDLAIVQESITAVVSEVDGVQAQWTLKATALRADGSPVFAGIGVAATASDDVEKSEIVLMANRLLFVPPDDLEAVPQPIFVAGVVDGVNTFVVPSRILGDRTYPGRVLVDGSIEGRSIAAEQIEGNHIRANTIEAGHLKANSIAAGNIQAGAVTAGKISTSSLSAISAVIGLLRTSASGMRSELDDNGHRSYDWNNVLRTRAGIW